ncbi:MAG: VOC family protein [Anaerobacillus sp.]|uniref:VOC family protein n=1 Tax=Anaerobacillus sp. TaxID=1872506 RepID=UPI00391D7D13
MKNARLYETHIQTTNLEEAIAFYQSIDLELAFVLQERRVAFFWLGDSSKKEQMLGIWEVSSEHFRKSHFAFYIPFEELLKVPSYLAQKGIEVTASFGLDASEPVVHSWMPAASYYFSDKDGNSLEYITVLQGDPIPELGAVHLSKWEQANKR